MEDITRDIQQAKQAGDQIILAADFNMDINGPMIKELMEELGLENAITNAHGEKDRQHTNGDANK